MQVLRRKRPDGSPLIRVEALVDGVVAFDDEADAARYAALLEADGSGTVRTVWGGGVWAGGRSARMCFGAGSTGGEGDTCKQPL